MKVKSVLAVLAGYVIFAVSAVIFFQVSRVDPHGAPPSAGFVIASIVYGAAFAFLSGYAAARIAGYEEVRHGLAVMVVIAILAIVSFLNELGYGAIWMEIATMFLISPFAIAGGAFRRRVAVKQLGT